MKFSITWQPEGKKTTKIVQTKHVTSLHQYEQEHRKFWDISGYEREKRITEKLFWAVKVDQQQDHEKELQFAGNLIVYSRTYTDIEVANIMVGYRKK